MVKRAHSLMLMVVLSSESLCLSRSLILMGSSLVASSCSMKTSRVINLSRALFWASGVSCSLKI